VTGEENLRVADEGEFALIARLRGMLEGGHEDLVHGIGDDTAVFRSPPGGLWAYTADAVVEGVHFDPAYTSWHSLGYKALAVNISDLASMGGCPPAYALVVLGMEAETEVEAVEEIYRGLRDCGAEFGCGVVGGDIVRSPSGMFISVSLVGHIPGASFLTRSGAREGQTVMVSGTLGDSCLGLRWLMDGRGDDNECARRHLYPRPRLEEGRRAVELGATAAIDVSDGLLQDLGHICEESGLGAEIDEAAVPLSEPLRRFAAATGGSALDLALSGGEDYALLFCVPPESAERCRERCRERLGLEVYPVGRMCLRKGLWLRSGTGLREVAPRGYDAFREGLTEETPAEADRG
jgi:thiamine-monophosphate kinase